jgi:hypothetical protein
MARKRSLLRIGDCNIGILAGFFGSLIFKEKLGIFSYLAILAALLAVIV